MKKIIHKFINNRGYELKKKYNGFSLQNDLKWFKERNFKTVLDVGANDGQFALFARRLFGKANIFSFEPLVSCCNNLNALFAGDSDIKVMNCALGDKEEELQMHHNKFSPSSSILNMSAEHIKNFPFTASQKSESIHVKTLDGIKELSSIEKDVLLKIDVQGYELKVLLGGLNFLKEYSPFIVLETSFTDLYENEPSFDEIYSLLRESGYSFRGVMDQMYSPLDGKILQADAMFEKL